MALSLAFFTVFTFIACAGSDQCPTLAQMRPCNCRDVSEGLLVFCSGNLAYQIRDVLTNVANTKRHIRDLKLQDVWLPNFPPNFLQVHDVYQLTIRNCSTSSVNENALNHVASTLNGLYLEQNSLERVPTQALKKCLNLTHLSFNDNRIEILHAEAFLGPKSLLNLYLQRNKIKFIDESAFDGIGKQLRYLGLDYNELTTVPCLPLRNQKSLKYLELVGNKIAALLPEELDAMGAESLEIFKLANNRIRHLPASVFKSMKLKLKYLDANAFIPLHSLEVLRITHNQLKTFPFETFGPLFDTLYALHIQGNPLHCDCHLGWMKGPKSWIVYDETYANCVTPVRYANVSLAEIEIDQLVCDDETSITPEPCCNCFNNTERSASSNTEQSASTNTEESVSNNTEQSAPRNTEQSASSNTQKTVSINASSKTEKSASSNTQQNVSSKTEQIAPSNTEQSASINFAVSVLQIFFTYLLNI